MENPTICAQAAFHIFKKKYGESFEQAMHSMRGDPGSEEISISYFKNSYLKRKIIDIVIEQEGIYKYYSEYSEKKQREFRTEVYTLAIDEFKEVQKLPFVPQYHELEAAIELLARHGFKVQKPKIDANKHYQYAGWPRAEFKIGDYYMIRKHRNGEITVYYPGGEMRIEESVFRNWFIVPVY